MLKKRYIVGISIFAAVILCSVAYLMFARFDDFSIVENLRTESEGRTSYVKALNGIVSYNPDGVALMDFSGTRKWNISYEMQSPQIDVSKEYILMYDKQGTVIEIANVAGETSRINTSFPIATASISDNGSVAAVMQQQENSHIILYDYEGNILAKGELHAGESGYPMALSLSSTGEILAASILHLSEADIKTEVVFYDFSEAGSINKNNKSATFSFSDTVIPVIDHVEEDKVIAVGTNSAVTFSSGASPKVTNEIFYENEVKSVIHNERFLGLVSEEENEDGQVNNVLNFYTINGKKRFSRIIDISYNKCSILENDEILFSDGKNTEIFTSYGACRFKCESDIDIQNMLYANGFRYYYLIHAGELSKIILS